MGQVSDRGLLDQWRGGRKGGREDLSVALFLIKAPAQGLWAHPHSLEPFLKKSMSVCGFWVH